MESAEYLKGLKKLLYENMAAEFEMLAESCPWRYATGQAVCCAGTNKQCAVKNCAVYHFNQWGAPWKD